MDKLVNKCPISCIDLTLRRTAVLYPTKTVLCPNSGLTCIVQIALRCRLLAAETGVRSQVSPCQFCSAQSGTVVTGFSPSTSVFPCQYQSTNAPYPFIHLPPTLYNISLPVLQFSPVSIIPPMLHTHSFTFHPRYIMFLPQFFSCPLSLSFHQCSILFCILVVSYL